MKKLYLIRHGQTEWNVEQRMQGRLDSALTELGQQQAITHGGTLQGLGGVDHLFVSPAGRAQETAYLINSFLGAPMSFEEELLERDCGSWSGLTVDEIQQRFPTEWDARDADPFDYRPPGGENLEDLVGRVQGFLDELFALPYETIGIITHGIMSRAILFRLLSLSKPMANRVRHPNNLFYQLDFAPTDIKPAHWLDGSGPNQGLLTVEAGAGVESLRQPD